MSIVVGEPSALVMKVVTWNVNSITMRLARATALLERHGVDVLCMQETKTTSDKFPTAAFHAAGYESAAHCQQARNGVAIVARTRPDDVQRGFDGDPIPEQARVISATVEGVRIVNVYVVNGKAVGAPEYELKLQWLDALLAWLRASCDPAQPLLIVGDFNIAPEDRDVHDPETWRDQNLCTEAERDRVRALHAWGLVDLARLHHDGPGPFTWWDYRSGAFHRGWGLRIDLALGTAPVADRCVAVDVDRDERKKTSGEGKPSDHAPVIVTLA